jgi:acetolactate synthase-1/3 small subunit
VKHTLSVLLENTPGALARIATMFARRGFNIESLAVGPTEHHIDQIEKQIHKLVNVLRVTELEPGESLERELCLIKVTAPPARRAELMSLGNVFGARVADLSSETLVFEIVGTPDEIDSFEELVRPHGVKELVRTGRIGLARSARSAPRARQHVFR